MANWFSSAVIFFLVFATLAYLVFGANFQSPFNDFLSNKVTLFQYIVNTIQDPTTYTLVGISITVAVITGNIIALSIPLIYAVSNFFIPITSTISVVFALAQLPPELLPLQILFSSLFQFFLIVAGIILLRGLVVF